MMRRLLLVANARKSASVLTVTIGPPAPPRVSPLIEANPSAAAAPERVKRASARAIKQACFVSVLKLSFSLRLIEAGVIPAGHWFQVRVTACDGSAAGKIRWMESFIVH